MKILHVVQGYFPGIGGTELAIQHISEELVRQFGNEVTVFTTNCYSGEAFNKPKLPRMPAGWEELNGVKVRRFSVSSRVSRLFRIPQVNLGRLRLPGNQYWRTYYQGPIIPGLSKAIQEADFDLLAASSFPLLHMYQSLDAAHRKGRPCVLIGGLHPQDEWGFQRPMIYKAIQKADGYIAYTPFEADYVIQRGANADNVYVSGLGVDLKSFEQTDPMEAKQRLGVPAEAPLVGYIGQLGWHKGVDALLRAMPRVWEVSPQTFLLIAGARATFAAIIDQFIEKLPPQQRRQVIIRYNFADDEKSWLFSAPDIFAYPSGYESFGISFVEAWAVKKPVIGCRRGAVPWVVRAGTDGLLVDFQDDAMLAEAIIVLLQNPQYARQLGENGYQKAVQLYNWPAAGQRFHEIYSSVLEKYQNKPAA